MWHNQPVSIPRRKARALLYRLAVRPEPVVREQLSFLFWPDDSEAGARRKLSHLLTHLRRALPTPDLITTYDDQVALDPQRVWTDTHTFLALSDAPQETLCLQNWQQAELLYSGSLMAGFSLPSSPDFEEWLMREQRHFEETYLHLVLRLIEEKTIQNELDAAIAYARRYLAIEPLNEAVHRRLIELCALNRDRSGALQQYAECVRILHEELDVEPAPETVALYRAVRDGQFPTTSQTIARADWSILPSLQTPLLGRDDALRTLQHAYRRVRSGMGRFVLVDGEPGIGKSRLLQEFTSGLGEQVRLLRSAAHPGSYKPPYYLILQALHSQMDARDYSDDPSWICQLPFDPVWLVELTRLLPELRTLCPDLPTPSATEPAVAQMHIFEALSQLFIAMAVGPQPVVLCLDNLHWSDAATLSWLADLSRRIERQRILVIGCYRPRESDALTADGLNALRDALAHENMLSEIHLDELSDRDIARIVQHHVGMQPDNDDLVQRLHEITGGNPFYLLEFLRILLDAGQAWPQILNTGSFSIPTTVGTVIETRLAHLNPVTRQVLEAGAILAPRFNFELVRLTSGRRELETVNGLDELVARHLLVEQNGAYTFHHDLVHRVILDGMSPTRRSVLHLRAARALQQIRPHAVTDLAHHFDAGGCVQQARHYHELAAQRARALLARCEADIHEQRLVELDAETAQSNSHLVFNSCTYSAMYG